MRAGSAAYTRARESEPDPAGGPTDPSASGSGAPQASQNRARRLPP